MNKPNFWMTTRGLHYIGEAFPREPVEPILTCIDPHLGVQAFKWPNGDIHWVRPEDVSQVLAKPAASEYSPDSLVKRKRNTSARK